MSRTANGSELAEAIKAVMTSPNVFDSNGEAANLIDVVHRQARNVQAAGERIGTALDSVAEAIRDLAGGDPGREGGPGEILTDRRAGGGRPPPLMYAWRPGVAQDSRVTPHVKR